MTPKPLDVYLVGSELDKGSVVLKDLNKFCQALEQSLIAVGRHLTRDATAIEYRLVEAEIGSCRLVFEPTTETGFPADVDVVEFFEDTVARLESGKPIDPRLEPEDLKVLRRLRPQIGTRLSAVQFGPAKITDQFDHNIDTLLAKTTTAVGDVTGRLERVNVHGVRQFTLFPIVGRPVVCQFIERMLPEVLAAVEKRVTVSGRLTYPFGSAFPSRARVDTFRVHRPDSELPTLADLRGIMARSPDGE